MQYVAAGVVSGLASLSIGTVLGFSAILMPQLVEEGFLDSDKSSYASWIGMSLFYQWAKQNCLIYDKIFPVYVILICHAREVTWHLPYILFLYASNSQPQQHRSIRRFSCHWRIIQLAWTSSGNNLFMCSTVGRVDHCWLQQWLFSLDLHWKNLAGHWNHVIGYTGVLGWNIRCQKKVICILNHIIAWKCYLYAYVFQFLST